VIDLNSDLGEGYGAWTKGDDEALLVWPWGNGRLEEHGEVGCDRSGPGSTLGRPTTTAW
jgi:hypothetical protein